MKKLILILLALFALASLAACNNGKTEDLTVENDVLGVVFSKPEGWELVQNDVVTQLTYGSGEPTNLTVGIPSTTPETFSAEDYEKSLTDSLKNCSVTARDVRLQSGSVSARSWIYTAEYANGDDAQTLEYMQSFVTDGQRTALFTLCSPKDKFDQYRKLVETSIGTLKFKDPREAAPIPHSGKVTNDAIEYSLVCPDGWDLIRNDGLIALRTADGCTLTGSAFTLDSTVSSLEDYMNDVYLPELRAVMGEVTVVGEYSETLTDSRYNGLLAEYTANVGGTDYRFLQKLVYRAGSAFSLLYTAPLDKFETHLEDAKAILESMSFSKE